MTDQPVTPRFDNSPFDLPGASPAVLLIHGFTSGPWELRALGQALHARGFAAKGLTLPGHGADVDALARANRASWRQEVRDAMAELLRSHESVVLVGQSLGGLLALDAAVERPRDPRLVGVATLACAYQFAPLTRRALALADALGSWLPDLRLAKRGGSNVQDARFRTGTPSLVIQPLRAARELLRLQAELSPRLATLTVPLLCLHGTLDTTALPAGSEAVLAAARAAPRGIRYFHRSAHLLSVDYDHEEVAREVAGFVTACGRSRTQPGGGSCG